ncbi:MAG: phosphatase PAP2 family protein [Candidatus Dormibacteraeota bacterium]|nr:phosphatase PAP2 family protein [Candidatus Dormibacteraeota bacterium]
MATSTQPAERLAATDIEVRVRFLVIALVAFVACAIDGFFVITQPTLKVDVILETAVQGVAWGPLVGVFGAIDWLEGVKQAALAGAGVLLVLILRRRAFFLMLWGALSAGAYTVIELLVRRPRPGADLVHVVRHTNGYGFPSGHVLFFTWFLAMLLLIFGRRYLPRPVYIAGWVVAGLVVLVVCLGRMYTAEHWPSDVAGGLLLGIGWVALGLSIRRISDPVLND